MVEKATSLSDKDNSWVIKKLGEKVIGHRKRAEAARLLGINPPADLKALKDRFSELEQEKGTTGFSTFVYQSIL